MAFFRNFRIHAHGVHVLLTLYNGIIVFLLAFFMGITQKKINLSMSAGSFLQQVPVLPVPADERLAYALAAFGILAGCGYIYSNAGRLPWPLRYAVFVLEMSLCIFLMHILNLAYDGVVLLLIADLMYCYQGRHQMIVMLLAMAVVYFVISYNVSLWQMKVVPFEVYAGYYNHEVQSMLLPLKNLLTYGNITIFVIYMVVLIQDKRRENEESAGLNRQLLSANNKLNESNLQLNISNAKLNAANKKLKEYAMTIASLTEIKERSRLAREIDDTLGHALTGIVAGLDACMVTLEIAPKETREQLGLLRETAQHGMVDVRRSMHMLRPDDLEKLSLQEALEKLARDFSRTAGVQVEIKFDKFPAQFREDEADVIYRIVQEGMTNASRHGHASHVGISLVGNGSSLEIVIADDGIGCQKVKKGFGLHHMQERLELLGGTLRFWSEKGFVLEICIPLNREWKQSEV